MQLPPDYNAIVCLAKSAESNAFVSVAFCLYRPCVLWFWCAWRSRQRAMRLLVLLSTCTGLVHILSFRIGYGNTQLRHGYWHLVQVPA
jgi:hypothetical protein